MKRIALFIACLLFGLMFLNAGLNKFFNYMPMPEDMPAESMKIFAAFGTIKWLMPLVGIAEILGGILIIFPKTRLLGALISFPVMVGIAVHNAVYEPSGLLLVGVMLAINIWVFVENRDKLRPLFS